MRPVLVDSNVLLDVLIGDTRWAAWSRAVLQEAAHVGRPSPISISGAHAAVRGYRLLTRAAARYRTSYPTVELIAP